MDAIELLREALLEALIVALPVLGIGLVVGLVVSLLQAVTQVQEQSVSLVPKVVAMVAVAVLLLGWMVTRLVEFAAVMFSGSGPGF